MEFQRLSNDEFDLIEQIEDGKPIDDLSKSPTLVDRLRPVCDYVNDLYKRNLSNGKYNVVGPMTLPIRQKNSLSTTVSMIGMEELNFSRIVPTSGGNFVCMFTCADYPDSEIMVKYESIENVIGKSGKHLRKWLEAMGDISKKREEIIESEKRKLSSNEYKETNEYGSW